ncbi:MAG: thermonuclease family protein [Porticoccaceae bacterium]
MAQAIESFASMIVGNFGLGTHGAGVASVKQAVHDGDTITVRALGNFGVRFLGIDTPEISFQLPGSQQFAATDSSAWQRFLTDPFAAEYAPLHLDAGLKAYMSARLGVGCAENHHRHAEAAQRALEAEVEADRQAQGLSAEDFRFYLRFAGEVMDGYGRLLAYVNRDEKVAASRPMAYNERLLQSGHALPYFIWPNINPFRRQRSLRAAVPEAGMARATAESEASLRQARQSVAASRAAASGVFAAGDPLRLEAFELRFLARRSPPSRWVIDLSVAGNRLIHPERYFEVPNPEDRLFVPDEYIELFLARGWVKQGI